MTSELSQDRSRNTLDKQQIKVPSKKTTRIRVFAARLGGFGNLNLQVATVTRIMIYLWNTKGSKYGCPSFKA